MASLSLVTFDEFTPRAEEIRERALAQPFEPVEWNGHTYHNIGKEYDPDLYLQMEKVIGGPIRPVMSYFRLEREGDESTAWIHADTALRTHFASVLYLSHPVGALQGTAFWKHKALNIDGIPVAASLDQDEFVGIYGPELRQDASEADKWTLSGVVGMKFNRFVMYPTRLFHSRYPKETYGKEKHEGRLIWVCFFDLAH